ncbi:MAG: ECF-type sigma factor [Planctomycetota bacterium]
MEPNRARFTLVLERLRGGDRSALDELFPLVYDELRAVARSRLARLPGAQTLQATALVHEAYLRLMGTETPWQNRAHFFGAAARAMRNALVESSRRRRRDKRGGDWQRVTLSDSVLSACDPGIDLLVLDDCLAQLEGFDPLAHQIVELRFFAGLTLEEVALALDRGRSTVDRHWSFARAWLLRRLDESTPARGPGFGDRGG